MTALDLWLRDLRIAELQEDGDRIELRWTQEAAEHHLGQTVLSLNLPVDEPDRPPSSRKVRPYLAGLLPEPRTAARSRLESRVGRTGILDLLLHSGADLAGAVRFSHPGRPPQPGTVEPLTDDDVAQLLSDPHAAAVLGGGSSDALPGVQHKIVLRLLADGTWAIARHGELSTHILKPRHGPMSLELEAFGSAASAAVGLTETPSWIQVIAGVEALVIPRYDRQSEAGAIRHDHQEDMAQALGLSPDDLDAKFQRGKRYPSLSAIAARLRAAGGSVEPLARLTALNVILGNTDAHAKNHAVLINEDGRARLSPAYDVAPLLAFETPRFALDIAGHSFVRQIGLNELRTELRAWSGAASRDTIPHVSRGICRVLKSQESAAQGLPSDIADGILARAKAFL